MKIVIAGKRLSWILHKVDRWAICLPPFGIYVIPEQWMNRDLLRHEGRHWLQYQRMGLVRFYSLYLWYTLRYGYWNNPMEIDARQ